MQYLYLYCPQCKNDLCSNDSFVSDTYDENADNHVFYKCAVCGQESDWNFDIAPIPVNWERLKMADT